MSMAPIQMFVHAAPGTTPGGCPRDGDTPAWGRHLIPRHRTSCHLSNRCQTRVCLCLLLHCMGPAPRASNLPKKTGAGRWMYPPWATFAGWHLHPTASALSLRHLNRQGIKPLLVWWLQTAALPFNEGCWHPAQPRDSLVSPACPAHCSSVVACARQASQCAPGAACHVSWHTSPSAAGYQRTTTTTPSGAKLVESFIMKVTASHISMHCPFWGSQRWAMVLAN